MGVYEWTKVSIQLPILTSFAAITITQFSHFSIVTTLLTAAIKIVQLIQDYINAFCITESI